jgi:hypothetical protein
MSRDNGAKIIGGNGVRIDFDFYPTPDEVTMALMDFLKLKPSNIWEPACGQNAISNVLERYGHTVISTDIKYGDDYFKTQKDNVDAIITNPPFKYAEQFIRKSLKDAEVSAMLLKTQYWHASKRTKLFKDNPPAFILALNWRPNFFGEAATGSPTMDFIWTVWIKGETDTRFRILNRPIRRL